MQGFGTLECGKNKTLTTQAHHHSPTAGGREFRATVPDFSVPHSSVRSGVAYPSTGEKQDLKTLYFCGFPIKDHQRAICYGGEGKQQNGERINATEANCLPLRRGARRRKP